MTKPIKRSPERQAIVDEYKSRMRSALPHPALKTCKKDGVLQVSPRHEDKELASVLFRKALGSTDGNFVDGLIRHIVSISSSGNEPDECALNFALSVIGGVEPKDQLESMLAAQMAAVHLATMRLARQSAHSETIPQQDSALNALNKLARTFANQMETLKRYRTGGEQRVTVSHVTVQEGGQAIVGDVTGVGGLRKNAE